MANQTFTITLTDAQKAQLLVKAQAAGIDPDGGTLPEMHGVVLSFAMNGNVVTFTVVKKPFYVSIGAIQNGVHELIERD